MVFTALQWDPCCRVSFLLLNNDHRFQLRPVRAAVLYMFWVLLWPPGWVVGTLLESFWQTSSSEAGKKISEAAHGVVPCLISLFNRLISDFFLYHTGPKRFGWLSPFKKPSFHKCFVYLGRVGVLKHGRSSSCFSSWRYVQANPLGSRV